MLVIFDVAIIFSKQIKFRQMFISSLIRLFISSNINMAAARFVGVAEEGTNKMKENAVALIIT